MRPLLPSQGVSRAFLDACMAELDALKPGNVHRHADDNPKMTVADFETSARAAAPAIGMPMLTVGVRIRLAVEATINVVGQNTNLGIVLLTAPLAQAALDPGDGDLRQRLSKVLAGLGVEDAREAYAAIRHAEPGGLGNAPAHDVSTEPSISLLEAMRAAETRDRIAWNYAHDFADIFDLGLPRLATALSSGWSVPKATTHAYLSFLSEIPDTLIARKFGRERAEEVRLRAQEIDIEAREKGSLEGLAPKLSAFDRDLKAAGLNPGTSADLTVATLFAAALRAAALSD